VSTILVIEVLVYDYRLQALQLGQFTNETGNALSHSPNSTTFQNVLRAFAEVSMVSIFLVQRNVSLIDYIAINIFAEDPQECSMPHVSLQLHRRHRCAPSDSSTAYHSRHFVGAHVPAEESDKDTDVDVYLNTTMFSTQQVRILLLHI
jgi:hypothetical protein